ncbi:hypothetical protein RRG08_020317 [Elysia crispata]|uniref:Uncharacterized protein n=1 Tax=Elysia crispata TaxID=231223 RepID=A0AAE0YBU4_9GAST|nr:hypothetical protein RRG08_020317 [Elysia crispata]
MRQEWTRHQGDTSSQLNCQGLTKYLRHNIITLELQRMLNTISVTIGWFSRACATASQTMSPPGSSPSDKNSPNISCIGESCTLTMIDGNTMRPG